MTASGSEFEHLVVTWSEHPAGTGCAAVAEGYRKRGQLEDAALMADECVARWPEFLPGHIVLSRVRRDAGNHDGAERALLAALAIDPSHPVVLEDLAGLSELTGHSADGRAWRQLRDASVEPQPVLGLPGFLAGPAYPHPMDGEDGIESVDDILYADDAGDSGEGLLTESLAALYEAQGHLERAADVYGVLSRRSPENPHFGERSEVLRHEIARRRPRPYDARESGGEPVGEWLRQVAANSPRRRAAAETGYDAFYRSAPSREHPEDFEAFQTWLKGLER